MKTSEESYREQKRLHPFLPVKPTTVVTTMILPGRRALGEQWQKVTIGHDGGEMVVDREATDAPVGNRPVVAVSGADAEYTNDILAMAAEKAAGRDINQMTYEEKWAIANEAWFRHIEQKKAAFKGISVSGAHISVHRGN
jgi:hypothetical protein